MKDSQARRKERNDMRVNAPHHYRIFKALATGKGIRFTNEELQDFVRTDGGLETIMTNIEFGLEGWEKI